MLVSRKSFSDGWTVVRGPKREHKVKTAGVGILERTRGMSEIICEVYTQDQRKTLTQKD